MKTFFTFLVLCLFGNSLAQRAMDTVDTKLGKIVVYSNQNWELIQEDTFDGVLNPQVHEIMNS